MHLQRTMRMTESEWRRLISEYNHPQKPKQRKPITGRKPTLYTFTVPNGMGHSVDSILALTKSEARSILKKSTGATRLPVGTKVQTSF